MLETPDCTAVMAVLAGGPAKWWQDQSSSHRGPRWWCVGTECRLPSHHARAGVTQLQLVDSLAPAMVTAPPTISTACLLVCAPAVLGLVITLMQLLTAFTLTPDQHADAFHYQQ